MIFNNTVTQKQIIKTLQQVGGKYYPISESTIITDSNLLVLERSLGDIVAVRNRNSLAMFDKTNGNQYTISNFNKGIIRDEVFKALMEPKPSNFFRNLYQCGLLSIVFPKLVDCINCQQGDRHGEDVFDHLMGTVDASVELTNKPMLRLACLLHDVGKPPVRMVNERGIHFWKHEVEGASIAYEWMKEYQFPKKDIDYVVLMIRWHMWRFVANPKEKTVKRFLDKVGRHQWRDLITLRCADRMGNKAKQGRSIVTERMLELIEIAQRIVNNEQEMLWNM